MKYQFQIEVKTSKCTQRASVQKKISAAIDAIPDYQNRVIAIAATKLPRSTSAALTDVKNYAEKLAQLESNLAVFAHDIGAPTVYGKKLKQLRQRKQLDPADASCIDEMATIAEQSPIIGRMKRFLIELPKDAKYDELRLLRQLWTAQIDLTQLAKEPKKIDGHVLHAFEEYHDAYVKQYMTHLACYEAAIADWQTGAAEREKKLFVIASLDAIPALGTAANERLSREIAALRQQYRPIDVQTADRRAVLHLEPSIAGITLFTPLPTTALQTMDARIDAALHSKINRIAEESVIATLQNSRERSIQKIAQLATLTQLDQLIKIFTKKTAPKIVHELQQLLMQPLKTNA